MIEKPIDAIEKADIDSLIQNAVQERRTIEYKQELPASSDEGKREFLADVSSFANAGGGDLIFGLRAKDGFPQEAIGCECIAEAEVLRLEGLLRDGVQPRVLGVCTKAIPGFARGPVVLMRIPPSWSGPHMVTFKNLSRFFTRNSAGKYQMDVTEIRAGFLGSEALPEKIRQFRLERLGKIVAGETPVPLSSGGRLILHIVPLASFSGNIRLDTSAISQSRNGFLPLGGGGGNSRINIDGIVTYNPCGSEPYSLSYCQVFRDGQIEAVDAHFMGEGGGKKLIPSVVFEEDVICAVSAYANSLKSLGVAFPLSVMLSMVGVGGAYLATSSLFFGRAVHPVDRNVLLLPDILIEDSRLVSEQSAAAKTLRPTFDAVWNACGYAQSLNYDDKGDWNPRR